MQASVNRQWNLQQVARQQGQCPACETQPVKNCKISMSGELAAECQAMEGGVRAIECMGRCGWASEHASKLSHALTEGPGGKGTSKQSPKHLPDCSRVCPRCSRASQPPKLPSATCSSVMTIFCRVTRLLWHGAVPQAQCAGVCPIVSTAPAQHKKFALMYHCIAALT